MFNMNLWNLSILRLNQLGYFEMLKEEDATEVRRNPNSDTVDLTLKVRERGKNAIGLNGGVSGRSGRLAGFDYSPIVAVGLGEAVPVYSDLGTIQQVIRVG